MKLTYSVNKLYPDVQYIATLDPLPMATVNPELTEAKISKERLNRKGITLVEDKELHINILLLFWYFLQGLTASEIVEKMHKTKYTFNHQIIPDKPKD